LNSDFYLSQIQKYKAEMKDDNMTETEYNDLKAFINKKLQLFSVFKGGTSKEEVERISTETNKRADKIIDECIKTAQNFIRTNDKHKTISFKMSYGIYAIAEIVSILYHIKSNEFELGVLKEGA